MPTIDEIGAFLLATAGETVMLASAFALAIGILMTLVMLIVQLFTPNERE